LETEKSNVSERFRLNEFDHLKDLVAVSVAYLTHKESLKLPVGFLTNLELALLNRATQMSTQNVLDLAPLMTDFGSTEMYECFDRILGNRIDELSPREILSAYVSFKTAQKAEIRPKILSLLLKKL
jgi:hypothetical protein